MRGTNIHIPLQVNRQVHTVTLYKPDNLANIPIISHIPESKQKSNIHGSKIIGAWHVFWLIWDTYWSKKSILGIHLPILFFNQYICVPMTTKKCGGPVLVKWQI